MENDLSFFDVNVDEDGTSLYLVAKAITKIQKQYGVIPMLYGKGNSAKVTCFFYNYILKIRKVTNDLTSQSFSKLF